MKTIDEEVNFRVFAALRFGIAALPFTPWLGQALVDSKVWLLQQSLWTKVVTLTLLHPFHFRF